MPKIAELREIDGAIWARVEMDLGSPTQLLSPEEIEANRAREDRQLSEIERMQAYIAKAQAAIRTTQCPRPANATPEHITDWTVLDCVACGDCGCDLGAAIANQQSANNAPK